MVVQNQYKHGEKNVARVTVHYLYPMFHENRMMMILRGMVMALMELVCNLYPCSILATECTEKSGNYI